jgi:hypothetical protein
MLGYKGFHSKLTGRNHFQYEVGKTYHMNADEIELCQSGFHFCQFPLDVLKYYNRSGDKYAVVKSEGKIISDDCKSVTNHITIVRLITRKQLKEMMPTHVIRPSGCQEWYKEGKLHRLEGPAIERVLGCQLWWVEGLLHRLDGRSGIQKEWWIEGQRHRIDGPAIESDDCNEWWIKGKRHRLGGPAIEFKNGDKEWWHQGNKK